MSGSSRHGRPSRSPSISPPPNNRSPLPASGIPMEGLPRRGPGNGRSTSMPAPGQTRPTHHERKRNRSAACANAARDGRQYRPPPSTARGQLPTVERPSAAQRRERVCGMSQRTRDNIAVGAQVAGLAASSFLAGWYIRQGTMQRR